MFAISSLEPHEEDASIFEIFFSIYSIYTIKKTWYKR